MLNTNEMIYDPPPVAHLSQAELMEKFNLAFYEGQNMKTFEEPEIKDDYLIDYLISNAPESDFDLNEFVQTFDENLSRTESTISETFSDIFGPPSMDLDDIDLDFQDLDLLPPVNSFGTYLRNLPEDSLIETNEDTRAEFGHLIGAPIEEPLPENQIILNQDEALLQDAVTTTLQCQWENCYQIYDHQTALVKHIEKCHVEVKRGEEFACFWANCPRKIKPFNARYKLLIHMRVHSGEKPNKCPFEGCNKAFSRLENLKIHQRSHTGERPYLCQFPTCTKSFSNSSDRAKHQRTHFDTKPYACQVVGCTKKYTDPSSLRKHVKNHTSEEQMLVKKKGQDECFDSSYVRKFFDPNRQKAVKISDKNQLYTDHNYSSEERKYDSVNIRQDLKNKISEKRLRKLY
ncbi:zinc finger protein GLIS1 [Tribolium castaneum]|uniref:Transcriptional activator cubitus interruptus-like Protein n=1 Tax=Tribolium castaneum TaxID=7070 RepID=D2A690_TRICA|nr:PREDICTED: zinc finger protein GLIS1 [Tribolium castaneum]EFA05809.2 Transcriptional activator cubitus interruptus-like Protein [Tribolium castaneum]|eukprot:XP_008194849.1 PREDICTED: zinc finger protein GLIS1 [Tribolium castaneum]